MIFILLRSYPAYAYAYADAYADAYNLLRSCVCPRADKLLTGPQTVVAQVLQRLIHFMLLCWAPLLQIPILPVAGLACSTNIHRQNSNPDFDFLARPAPAGRVFSPKIPISIAVLFGGLGNLIAACALPLTHISILPIVSATSGSPNSAVHEARSGLLAATFYLLDARVMQLSDAIPVSIDESRLDLPCSQGHVGSLPPIVIFRGIIPC